MSNPRCKKDLITGRFISGDTPRMADKPICVRLPVEIDRTLRDLPNRTKFLRDVITKAVREQIIKSDSPSEQQLRSN